MSFHHTFTTWASYVEAWGLLHRVGASFEYNAHTQTISVEYDQFKYDDALSYIKRRLEECVESDTSTEG